MCVWSYDVLVLLHNNNREKFREKKVSHRCHRIGCDNLLLLLMSIVIFTIDVSPHSWMSVCEVFSCKIYADEYIKIVFMSMWWLLLLKRHSHHISLGSCCCANRERSKWNEFIKQECHIPFYIFRFYNYKHANKLFSFMSILRFSISAYVVNKIFDVFTSSLL